MRILGEYDRVLEATLDEDGTVTFTCDADYLPKPKGVTLTLSQVQGAILELCGMWSEGRRQEKVPEYQHPEDDDDPPADDTRFEEHGVSGYEL